MYRQAKSVAQKTVIPVWIAFCCVVVACMPEEEIVTEDPGAVLTFSRDTVLFDTLFSTVGSTTKSFKVYNANRQAVTIAVELAGGSRSPYSIYINGEQRHYFEQLRLLGGDSLLVLVEVNIGARDEDTPFLVKDSLVFTTNRQRQDVKLLTWGQDAHFLSGLHIRKDTTFSAQRPYVVLDSLKVGPQATLLLDKGTRLYFHTGAELTVEGSLQARGTPEETVQFLSERQDGSYEHGPGQWQGIFFTESSFDNLLEHALIRNATIGIALLGNDADTVADLSLNSTIIENMSDVGIAAVDADIDARNVLVNNCVRSLLLNLGKGYYRYLHCTFANDYSSFPREGPALFFADTLSGTESSSQSFRLILKNNIIWGNRSDELTVVTEKPALSTVEVVANLIRTRAADEYGGQNLLNEDPQFVNPAEHDYHPDSASAVIDRGVPTAVRQDLEGVQRDSLPDLGAYEYQKK